MSRLKISGLLAAATLVVLATVLFVPAHARDRAPARIVSLAPHLTELAFEAGLGDRLVGVVAWSDYPARARELPRIGDAFRFDLEAILRLDATHALAWKRGTPQAAIAELENLGIEVVVMSTGSLEEIPAAIEQLGALAGDDEQAARAAARFRQRRQELAAEYGDGPDDRLEVFYQVSAQPLFTLGGDHVINDVLALCGARNAFADLDEAAASVDLESVLERDPLAIVASRGEDEEAPAAHWREYDHLRAVRCGHLLDVDPALLVRPTPRLLDGAAMLCEWLERRVRRAEDPACRSGRD